MAVNILTEEQLKLKGIFVETGLHIGASDDAMKIGGIDLPVVKREVWVYYNRDKDKNKKEDPYENGEVALSFDGSSENYRKLTEPYIPGSSIKGKVRSLLEHFFGLVRAQVKVIAENPDLKVKPGVPIDSQIVDKISSEETKLLGELIIAAFGESGSLKKDKKTEFPEITRFVFRDCYITPDIRVKALENEIELFEAKTENSIDRIKGTVNQNLGGLRTSERVPSGVRFDFKVSIRTFTDEEKNLFENLMKLGLALLQLDGLGGSTSRGYGQISFLEEVEVNNTKKLQKWNVTEATIHHLKGEILKEAKKWKEVKKKYKDGEEQTTNSNNS